VVDGDPKIRVQFENVEVLPSIFVCLTIFLGDCQGVIHLPHWVHRVLLVLHMFLYKYMSLCYRERKRNMPNITALASEPGDYLPFIEPRIYNLLADPVEVIYEPPTLRTSTAC
jgi:hypothetical protein